MTKKHKFLVAIKEKTQTSPAEYAEFFSGKCDMDDDALELLQVLNDEVL